MADNKRYIIKITGIVQGVGFRPFIYTKAKSLSLNGWVNNISDGVVIEAEGKEGDLAYFVNAIEKDAPALSHIRSIDVTESVTVGYNGFEIRESFKSEENYIYISPDVSVCEDCRRELYDTSDRRYLYPFINCTNCGPRFTITKDTPYDRVNTTMDKFPMCRNCAEEYNNPLDRRYHAQPVSCYECGPKLRLLDNTLKEIFQKDLIEYTIRLMAEGNIIAIKGLGGYHLACDANNETAVRKLRDRKVRDDKPFAVMVRDVETALRLCSASEEEVKLLSSVQKPIVLLKKSRNYDLPVQIAPGNPFLGVMLPYTPVHMLLFKHINTGKKDIWCPDVDSRLSALVMTSGNRSSEPIYYEDNEAFENLKDIADFFLSNDREIHVRTDDSVTRVFSGKEFVIRRSRGYAPIPVVCDIFSEVFSEEVPSVLACGGELKNTFCMNRGNEFFLSHHIGDLENYETLISFEEGIQHFSRILNIDYKVVAYDIHPEYLSSKYSVSVKSDKKIPVQHHHAHIASCMAENNLSENIIGVAFDGTGLGEDGNIWGGEFFSGSYRGFKREGHLDYTGMPGGEAAIREPWRMAVSYLYKYLHAVNGFSEHDWGINCNNTRLFEAIGAGKISIVLQMLERGVNTPLTSSMGRLFDAVSALIGIRHVISYEGQAAIELEYIADMDVQETYEFIITEGEAASAPFRISTEGIIRGILKDMTAGVSNSRISGKFHETAAEIILKGCVHIRKETGLNKVVLSGGVFQNMTLLEKSLNKLRSSGFEAFIHSRVPTNDAGISLGQAVMAIFKA
ncbi:MAG: carbamoyltransferase HypF [Clostridia bacterium]|nr:carbamoyltransferase HypF [Clostridia bacterium]